MFYFLDVFFLRPFLSGPSTSISSEKTRHATSSTEPLTKWERRIERGEPFCVGSRVITIIRDKLFYFFLSLFLRLKAEQSFLLPNYLQCCVPWSIEQVVGGLVVIWSRRLLVHHSSDVGNQWPAAIGLVFSIYLVRPTDRPTDRPTNFSYQKKPDLLLVDVIDLVALNIWFYIHKDFLMRKENHARQVIIIRE